MDVDTRRSIIRNIVHGILIAHYHVPNFDYDKVFGSDFGFSLAAFDNFLDLVSAQVNAQIEPSTPWEYDDDFARSYLTQTVSALVDAINAALGAT